MQGLEVVSLRGQDEAAKPCRLRQIAGPIGVEGASQQLGEIAAGRCSSAFAERLPRHRRILIGPHIRLRSDASNALVHVSSICPS
jgi:hypothetical protein